MLGALVMGFAVYDPVTQRWFTLASITDDDPRGYWTHKVSFAACFNNNDEAKKEMRANKVRIKEHFIYLRVK